MDTATTGHVPQRLSASGIWAKLYPGAFLRRACGHILALMGSLTSRPHRREEVYNVHLAQLLGERGATRCEAEQRHGDDIPDVLFEWFGLDCVLEAKYDIPGKAMEVSGQVANRLAAGFGILGMAVLYPQDLVTTLDDPGVALLGAAMKVQISAGGHPPGRWHDVDGVEGIVGVLEHARAALISDDQLATSVRLLGQSVDALARGFVAQPGHLPQLSRLVTAVDATSAAPVSAEEGRDAARIGALAVITALMLQVVLGDQDPHVPKVVVTTPALQRQSLLRGWRTILDHDYRAVFEIAAQILDEFGDTDARLGVTLVETIRGAEEIVSKGVFGRHDLIGRIYHSLLAQQKFLATYYTSVPAATLLAALATNPSDWPDIDWTADPNVFPFRFGDPSCGTGTLLAACLGSVRAAYALERRRVGKPVDALALGQHLIEDNIYGLDILAYAVQVCAATLLLSTPGTTVTRSRLMQLPFGGPNGHLGSLDLLLGDATGVLFGAWGNAITPDGVVERNVPIDTPAVDLVIMNPPFTRTGGTSRLLGSLTPNEWPHARMALTALGARPDVLGRVVAGLGALFVPLADRMLSPGGRMALVLPKNVLTGAQWDRTRQLFAERYHVETVICSHEPGRWNFSDSTDLSEVLIIARKLDYAQPREGLYTRWVQLTRNPDNPIDALGVASALNRMSEPSPNGESLEVGSGLYASVGQVFSRPTPRGSDPWRHAIFVSGELDQLASGLADGGTLPLTGCLGGARVPVVPLESIGEVGPDHHRLDEAFVVAATATSYPYLRGHASDSITSLASVPNSWLAVSSTSHRQPEAAAKYAERLWKGAGSLMVGRRLRLTTQRVTAVRLPYPALANTLWPVHFTAEDPDAPTLQTLWLNSILGLVAWVGSGQETQGPWMEINKNQVLRLPMLDLTALNPKSRSALLQCWDEIHEEHLLPISEASHDPARGRLDATMARALDLPIEGVERLRRLFCAEPRFEAAPPKARKLDDEAPAPSLFD